MLRYHHLRRQSRDAAPRNYESRVINRSGGIHHIYITIDLIPGTRQSVASFIDVTPLKQALTEQKALQEKLSKALAHILSGFIPICSNCKKIRDDKDHWLPVETYISERTRIDFSHSICPDCAKKLYPGLM